MDDRSPKYALKRVIGLAWRDIDSISIWEFLKRSSAQAPRGLRIKQMGRVTPDLIDTHFSGFPFAVKEYEPPDICSIRILGLSAEVPQPRVPPYLI